MLRTFNGAAACSRRRLVESDLLVLVGIFLQWGRRMFAAETVSRALGACTLGPFNGAAACSRRRLDDLVSELDEESLLQWGRRMFAAETCVSGAVGQWVYTLQWGRRMFAAETPAALAFLYADVVPSMGPPHVRGGDHGQPVQVRGPNRPFNGAAACSRRRRAAAERAARAIYAPSMGPPHVRGGDLPDGKRVELTTGPSMGPPHVRGGDQGPAPCETGGSPAFNGAAACSRRRPPSP